MFCFLDLLTCAIFDILCFYLCIHWGGGGGGNKLVLVLWCMNSIYLQHLVAFLSLVGIVTQDLMSCPSFWVDIFEALVHSLLLSHCLILCQPVLCRFNLSAPIFSRMMLFTAVSLSQKQLALRFFNWPLTSSLTAVAELEEVESKQHNAYSNCAARGTHPGCRIRVFKNRTGMCLNACITKLCTWTDSGLV